MNSILIYEKIFSVWIFVFNLIFVFNFSLASKERSFLQQHNSNSREISLKAISYTVRKKSLKTIIGH
jgi:hypothetical protein